MIRKTKEQIMGEVWECDPDELWISLPQKPMINYVSEAMILYAQQEAIAFSIFKREYQLIEGMNHKHDTTDKIGMVSWIGASDERIWSAYKEGKQILRWIENPEHPDNRLSKIKSKEQ